MTGLRDQRPNPKSNEVCTSGLISAECHRHQPRSSRGKGNMLRACMRGRIFRVLPARPLRVSPWSPSAQVNKRRYEICDRHRGERSGRSRSGGLGNGQGGHRNSSLLISRRCNSPNTEVLPPRRIRDRSGKERMEQSDIPGREYQISRERISFCAPLRSNLPSPTQ